MAFFLEQERIVHETGQGGYGWDMIHIETYNLNKWDASDQKFGDFSWGGTWSTLVWKVRILENLLFHIW